MNSVVGPGYFQVTSSADLPDGLAAVEKRWLRERRAIAADVARILWSAAGGNGDPLARLAATVSAHLSSYFTAAVKIDVGERWQTAADLAYDAIMAALERKDPASPSSCPSARTGWQLRPDEALWYCCRYQRHRPSARSGSTTAIDWVPRCGCDRPRPVRRA